MLGVGLALVAAYGALMQRYTRNELLAIRDTLELETIPEIKILEFLLWVSAPCFAAVSAGLLVLWCK